MRKEPVADSPGIIPESTAVDLALAATRAEAIYFATAHPIAAPRHVICGKVTSALRFAAMDKLIAGSIGAIIGLIAVFMGGWLNERRELRHWRRDQMLKISVDFATPTRFLLNHYQWVGEEGMDQGDRRERRDRMQSARTAVHLLFSPATVELMEKLVKRLYETTPQTAKEEIDETNAIFKELVARFRAELNHHGRTP